MSDGLLRLAAEDLRAVATVVRSLAMTHGLDVSRKVTADAWERVLRLSDPERWPTGSELIASLASDNAVIRTQRDEIATLQATVQRYRQASSHAQQLRDHYQQALSDLTAAVTDYKSTHAAGNALEHAVARLEASAHAAGRALTCPPEWDGVLRP